MNIVLFTYNINALGGIEQVSKDLKFSLQASGYVVKVISINEIKPKNKIFKKLYTIFLLKRKIKNVISSSKTQLVISMHPFLLKYLSYRTKYKILCWVHGIDVFGKMGLINKKYLDRCTQIIAVSNFTRNHLIKNGFNPLQIKVIHNMVDTNIFAYKPLNNLADTFNILTTGRLSKKEQYKGHDLVIKALRLVIKSTNVKIRYHIVGDGDDIERLKKLVTDEKLDKYVEFWGKVSFQKLIHAYEISHLFVMPSFFYERDDGTFTGEGFGIVYIEAGAIGRAVIGCDEGGQTDIILDGYNGKLVKPDINDISSKIIGLVNNRADLERMGKNNRKLVEENFSRVSYNHKIAELIVKL